jgi:hypothetical protein
MESESELIIITRQDKKKILFYNDQESDLSVDDEFKSIWRSVAVDKMSDETIEQYLDKQGLNSMRGQGVKKSAGRLKLKPIRKPQKKRVTKKPKDNEHVANDLITFEF